MALEGILTIVAAQTKMATAALELEATKDEARLRSAIVDGMVHAERWKQLKAEFDRLLEAKKAYEAAGIPWPEEMQQNLVSSAQAMGELANKDSTTQ